MSDDRFNSLIARRPGADRLDDSRATVDAVIDRNIKTRAGGNWKSDYLPKATLETETEYQKRLAMTPTFTQTPKLLTDRQAALWGAKPDVSAPGLEEFIAAAGAQHETLDEIAQRAIALAQRHGYAGALIDHDSSGRPYTALYSAANVLDWQYGTDGQLDYVKFAEYKIDRPSWNAEPESTIEFRIATRTEIQIFVARKDNDGNWNVTERTPVEHGQRHVPACIMRLAPDDAGIGTPILAEDAESDIAATRILSDILWNLYIAANPILTFKTNKNADQLGPLQLGTSRYVPLENERHNQNAAESLEFVQLETAGIELQFRAHSLMRARGDETHAAQQPGAAAIPVEKSGVAHAWEFRTGEERTLQLLANAVDTFASRILELVALSKGIGTTPVYKINRQFGQQNGTQNTSAV